MLQLLQLLQVAAAATVAAAAADFVTAAHLFVTTVSRK